MSESRDQPRYAIYQLNLDNPFSNDLFALHYKDMLKMVDPVTMDYYKCVYEGKYNGESLDAIYERFNIAHPEDFTGHSLSVSDVVVIHDHGEDKAYYVDAFGFQKLPSFFMENPLKAAEEALEDDYDMIDGIINNGSKKTESVIDTLHEKMKEAADQKMPENSKELER